jgi:hypothetical protein
MALIIARQAPLSITLGIGGHLYVELWDDNNKYIKQLHVICYGFLW